MFCLGGAATWVCHEGLEGNLVIHWWSTGEASMSPSKWAFHGWYSQFLEKNNVNVKWSANAQVVKQFPSISHTPRGKFFGAILAERRAQPGRTVVPIAAINGHICIAATWLHNLRTGSCPLVTLVVYMGIIKWFIGLLLNNIKWSMIIIKPIKVHLWHVCHFDSFCEPYSTHLSEGHCSWGIASRHTCRAWRVVPF